MPFTATSQQLKILKQAVDDYCRDCGIVTGTNGYMSLRWRARFSITALYALMTCAEG